MNASTLAWLRPLMWAGAVILFVFGGYSDTATTEMWGWGFALLTGGVAHEASARHEVGVSRATLSEERHGPAVRRGKPCFPRGPPS